MKLEKQKPGRFDPAETDGISPLIFPCQFPVKIMGHNSDRFEEEIVAIARQHIPQLDEERIFTTPSRTEKYLSVTITFRAESREHLDKLYHALNAHSDVRMVL